MFDLSITKILVLAVLALIIFGPERLPKVAAQAGRALRDLRRIAENAKADLQQGLGPEFQDFDISDLNPKSFVRKHLWDEFDATEPATVSMQKNGSPAVSASALPPSNGSAARGSSRPLLSPGERPPFDAEAT